MRTRRSIGALTLAASSLAACAHDDLVQPVRDVALAPTNPPPSAFQVTVLKLPPNAMNGGALGINDAGWVVGWTDSIGKQDGRGPTLWKPGAAPIRLYVDPSFTAGAATDINQYGDVVGFTGGFGNPFAAGYVWPVSGKNRQGPLYQFTPLGLNAAGTIVGKICDGRCEAGRKNWLAPATMLPCPDLVFQGGCYHGTAASINERGDAAGTYTYVLSPTPTISRAIVWTADDFLLDMANVSGNRAGSEATHISNNLSVSGAHKMNGIRRPVVWYLANGSWREFGNGAEGRATSVSDSNRVVGNVTISGQSMAFTATTVADFGLLPIPFGFAITSAADVNTCGTIVGTAQSLTGHTVAVVWQAVVKGSPRCDTAQPAP
jgi:hypothetical protein